MAVAAVAALFAAAPASTATARPAASPYRGLATWISIYSPSFHAAPQRLAAALAARRVRTLFLQTGNYRQRTDLVGPAQLGKVIEAMHARHIAVVAWYLPALTDPAVDLRRSLAAARFASARGERFRGSGLLFRTGSVGETVKAIPG